MAALMEEAVEALERFIETGSRDQAQEAFDCLRACGLSPLSLGDNRRSCSLSRPPDRTPTDAQRFQTWGDRANSA